MGKAQILGRDTSDSRDETVAAFPSEFTMLVGPRGDGWIDLRTRLARSARELHFVAVASQSANGSSILMIAGRLAELAMSIPMRPEAKPPDELAAGTLVNASTLFAAQMQRFGGEADREDDAIPAGTAPDI
jgi:hypothetical protein